MLKLKRPERVLPQNYMKTAPWTVKDRIVRYCREPRTKAEKAEMIGIGTPYYVMAKYIAPLIEEGVISMTIPEKPRSKNQKYYKAG